MITLIKVALLSVTMTMIKTTNPMKLSMMLMLTSMMIFFNLQEKSQNIWYPTIFLLLFLGGILIMFMILSALMPNQKSMKLKMSVILPLMFSIPVLFFSSHEYTNEGSLKWTFQSSLSMELMLLIMVIYFFLFIHLISKEKIPLRTLW